MSEAPPVVTGRLRTAAAIGVVAVVAGGVVLRFVTHSALWLDEALTVNRSRLPLTQIAGSVKQDGAPPLYYYLLHFWMELFGQSNLATRSLEGVIGVATLPVAWLAGNRFGGRTVAWTTLVLLASAPFAVYYATEARMYGLIILLTGCGFLALAPRPGVAPSGQPDRRRGGDGRSPLHPVLVPLPGGRGGAVAGRHRPGGRGATIATTPGSGSGR